MSSPNLTTDDIDKAIARLSKSERGRIALWHVGAFLQEGLALDSENRTAVMTLLYAAFTDWPGYVKEQVNCYKK